MQIYPNDIPIIPKEIALKGHSLYDSGTQEDLPCNETVLYILNQVDGKTSVQNIAENLSTRYEITYKEAITDTIILLEDLNKNHLLNIRKREVSGRLKSLWVYLYTFQWKQIYSLLNTRERYDIPNFFRNPLFLLFYLFAKILIVHPFIFIGMFLFFISSPNIDIGLGLLFTLNIAVAMAVHEYFHGLALFTLNEGDKLSFIGKDKFTIGVYRRQLAPVKSIIVALSGPLFPFLIGLYLLKLGEVMRNPEVIYMAIIWIANIATLLSTDGKNIFKAVLELIKQRRMNNG